MLIYFVKSPNVLKTADIRETPFTTWATGRHQFCSCPLNEVGPLSQISKNQHKSLHYPTPLSDRYWFALQQICSGQVGISQMECWVDCRCTQPCMSLACGTVLRAVVKLAPRTQLKQVAVLNKTRHYK